MEIITNEVQLVRENSEREVVDMTVLMYNIGLSVHLSIRCIENAVPSSIKRTECVCASACEPGTSSRLCTTMKVRMAMEGPKSGQTRAKL